MTMKPELEIPEAVRQMTERNLDQARTAYNQFLALARQGQDALASSQNAMSSGAMDVQTKALSFAEKNIEDGFSFAAELARAKDFKEYFEIQQKWAQKQMQTYAQQTQELGRVMTDAAQKSRPKM